MAQLDDIVGCVMKKLKDWAWTDDTIVLFTTDNGTENFTWPDGGQTPFAQCQGDGARRRLPRAVLLRWPGHVPAGEVENGIFSGLDWLPTFAAAAGDPNIAERIAEGQDRSATGPTRTISTATTRLAAITGKGPSKRHEIFYLGESTLGAVRIDDYKYPLHRPAGRLARREDASGRSLSSPTSASIRSSARAGRTTEPRTVRSNTSTGSSTSSGASCSSSS